MRAKNLDANRPQMASQTVVVAKQALLFGTELNASMLQEVPWPSNALPSGAYAKIQDIVSGGRRVVLSAIEANEPVLALKVPGAGQRATLSALVKPGMKAVTIRVNDVEGVGGFVLPGDHVDVVLTRQVEKGNATTQVVLQNTRVLAVDQTADERAAKATVAKGHAGSRYGRCTKIVVGVIGRQSLLGGAQGWRNCRNTDAQSHAERFGDQRTGEHRQGCNRDSGCDARVCETGIHR